MARRHSVLLTGALVMTGSLAATLPADAADNGLFAPYVAYDPGGDAASVAIGDVTGDRLDDVVLTTAWADDPTHAYSVWVYPQQADGSLGAPLQTATTGGPGSPMAVALADLDEDGDLDAAVTTDTGVDVLEAGRRASRLRVVGVGRGWHRPRARGRQRRRPRRPRGQHA